MPTRRQGAKAAALKKKGLGPKVAAKIAGIKKQSRKK
jgi:hypothetical protein